MVRPEGLRQFKKSTSSELEPATLRLAAHSALTVFLEIKVSAAHILSSVHTLIIDIILITSHYVRKQSFVVVSMERSPREQLDALEMESEVEF
jgi:hypothetical protein